MSYQSVVDFYKYWILNQSYHLAVYVCVLWLVNFCWTISEKLHCRIYTNQNSCLFRKRGICTYQVIGSIMICVTSVPLPETKQMWNMTGYVKREKTTIFWSQDICLFVILFYWENIPDLHKTPNFQTKISQELIGHIFILTCKIS